MKAGEFPLFRDELIALCERFDVSLLASTEGDVMVWDGFTSYGSIDLEDCTSLGGKPLKDGE
jgi:hypothetical protein